MLDPHSIETDFLAKVTKIVEENISNEQFGVSELARETGMSRSNLLRKIKKITRLSVSRFIREIRLKYAMEMLTQTSLNVSEVSYEVGFGSVSYFIKCFHDYYGYPPGEVGKNALNEKGDDKVSSRSHTHQLAAIMFTDIQGYTALMQQNEEKALAFRNRHREIFNAVTKKYKGRILQYYGDGTLSTFASAIDAVRCGIEMQLAFREQPKIPVRVGIHSGDIIFSDDDIIGDGVNVASRVESLAVPQSVFISEKVYDEVKNQSDIQTVSMGMFELKNVGKAMEVFAISNPGLIVPERSQIKGKVKTESPPEVKPPKTKGKGDVIKWVFMMLTVVLAGYLIYTSGTLKKNTPALSTEQTISKKSIAVLPFINDSGDSTNVYIINGLMESILNNLQKIEDLKVISRTSVEKYRNNAKTIPEIAKELNVNYFVVGSGQKIGDQILLNIQLIEGPSDKHLWGQQYDREAKDIFKLQMDVARNIADEIQVIITPEEVERISRIPTDDLVAYDYFLKGLDSMHKVNGESLKEAISYFEKAIEQDNGFARAYADIAISYFFLDVFQAEKKYSVQINNYADKALFIDSQLPQSLMAKAFYYLNNRNYEQAVPYLEKALEYNPNSAQAINTLADFYANHIPNPGKYLEYALKGIGLDIAANDSVDAGFIYMHLSNAFVQSGFIKEAEKYIKKSFEYNPDNLFADLVNAYVQFGKNSDLQQTKDLLIQALEKDTNHIYVIQEVGKIYYYLRDYESAYQYYKKFVAIKEAQNLDVFRHENDKIGLVFSKMGLAAESEKYINDIWEYTQYDQSLYRHLNLALLHSFRGETKEAIEELKLFSQQGDYDYWVIAFTKMDPLFDNIKGLPEFKKLFKDIENKFWDNHKRIKAGLEEKGLL